MSTFKPKEYTPDVARIISDNDTRAKKRVECELLKPDAENAITSAYEECVIDYNDTCEVYLNKFASYEEWREEHADLIRDEIQHKRAAYYDYEANFNMEPYTYLRWYGIEVEYLEALRDAGLDPLFVEITPSGKEGPDVARLYFYDNSEYAAGQYRIGMFVEHNYSPTNPDVFKEIIEKHLGPRMLTNALGRMEHGMMLEED